MLNEYATGITIKDTNTAHALLQTTDKAGILPLDAKEDFDFAANVTGETIAIAAEGQKAGTEAYSNVVVFSSKAMLLSGELSYASFNNAAYFMNMLNTITEKEDNTVVIEGKSLENATLGAPGAETSNAVMIVFMIVLPAGTKFDAQGTVLTNGGRVLGVTATGANLKEARANAYEATKWVNFDNKYCRSDIGKAIDEA